MREHIDLPTKEGPMACAHEDLTLVGAGGSAEYYRCVACGLVVIRQAGKLWTLRRRAPAMG